MLHSFVKARIDLLELKSHIIHVLKIVEYNRALKSNRFFSVNKRLKKISPPFYWPASFKARLSAPTLILFIALFEWKLHVLGAEDLQRAIYLCIFSDRVKRNKSIYKSKFSVGDEYTERNKKTKDWKNCTSLLPCREVKQDTYLSVKFTAPTSRKNYRLL